MQGMAQLPAAQRLPPCLPRTHAAAVSGTSQWLQPSLTLRGWRSSGTGPAAAPWGAPRLLAAPFVAAVAAAAAARRCDRGRSTRRRAADEPIFATMLSKQRNWRAAVAELAAEAKYQLRSRPGSTWDFGIAWVQGYEGTSLGDIARALNEELNMQGSLVGVAVDGCSGPLSSADRGECLVGEADGMMLTAVQVPEPADGRPKEKVQPFFLSKKELLDISQLVCRVQSQTRVRGAEEPATPRAWRRYLGAEGPQPKGMLLFMDPLASKYTVQTVLASLDLAFPHTVKFGGVCADVPPFQSRLATFKDGEMVGHTETGIAGIILPSCLSMHALVSPGSVRVGPELRVTLAKGQVVQEINEMTATQALAEVTHEAGPLERMLVERSGFLMGFEAPEQLDPAREKVYDDAWGSSERLPSYAQLQKQANGNDWLVRSIDPLPNGTIVVQREDLKRVPPRVGPSWVRCQLHVSDGRWARGELRLMVQRYLGARMMLNRLSPPIGAFVCACSTWGAGSQEDSEVGYTELVEAFGDRLPVARIVTHGEVAPPGVALGGTDQRRTARLGHTCSVGLLSYEP